MAGFHEALFPEDIAYRSEGGPGFKTQIIELDSNVEQRISRQSTARHRYNVAYGIRSHDQLATVKTFFIAREGALNGFPFKDFSDFTTAPNRRDAPTSLDEKLLRLSDGQVDADGTETQFQLVKRYASGAQSRVRNIEKPEASTIVVAVNEITTASGWTVNTTTGVVTFTVAPTAGHTVKGGCNHYTPVRFAEDADDFLNASIDDFDSGSITSIPLVEIVNTGPVDDEFYYGGAIAHATGDAFSITQLQGRVHTVDPSADLIITLPDMTGVPGGGAHFYIIHSGASNTATVKDFAGVTVVALTAGVGKTFLWDSVNSLWYAI